MATYQDYVQAVETDWLTAQRSGNRTEELLLAAIFFRLSSSPQLAVTWLAELVEKTNDPDVRTRYQRVLTDVQTFANEGETHE